jgi:hypothetical protein
MGRVDRAARRETGGEVWSGTGTQRVNALSLEPEASATLPMKGREKLPAPD